MKKWFVLCAMMMIASSSVAFSGSMMTGDRDTLPPGHPPLDAGSGMDGGSGGAPLLSGVIEETMDTGNYTYILVNTGEKSVWAAAEQFEAVVGQRVVVPRGMLVKNFESPSLNRTFDELYFADSVQPAGSGEEAVAHNDHTSAPADADAMDPVAPVEGGLTVAEIHQRRAELAGSTVTVRGKVTKYTERVMGQNWLHISDGSAEGSAGDLTVSTHDAARKGDVVTVTGPVAINEDLGHGYFYEVLIKGASVARE